MIGKLALMAAALSFASISYAATAIAPPTTSQAAADELISADRAFSQSGASSSLTDSIAAMLDDEAVMPVQTGTFAKGKAAVVEALRANPQNASAKATWAPIRAGLSGDGTHGFTYGFMTISDEGKPDRRAKYLAYWVKRPNGWRVAAYKRAGSEAGEVQTALRPAVLLTGVASADANVRADQVAALRTAEQAFSDRAQKIGLGPAFTEFGTADAMNIGQSPDFTFGNTAIGADMPPGPGSPLRWAADEGAMVSPSGDLGVTFGHIHRNGPTPPGRPATIAFFTVWHRVSPDAPWRYIAE